MGEELVLVGCGGAGDAVGGLLLHFTASGYRDSAASSGHAFGSARASDEDRNGIARLSHPKPN
jgi:hypothetical protein